MESRLTANNDDKVVSSLIEGEVMVDDIANATENNSKTLTVTVAAAAAAGGGVGVGGGDGAAPTTLAAQESFSQRWTAAIDNVRVLICGALKAISHWSATHPWTTVVSVTVLSVGMVAAGLFTNFSLETDGDILWPPQGSTTQLHQEWIQYESQFAQEHYYSIIYVTVPKVGDNILDRAQQSLDKVFEIYDAIRSLPDYNKICGQPYTDPETDVTMECDDFGVFEFWNSTTSIYQQQVTNDQDAIAQMSATKFPSGKPVDRSRTFGNPIFDPTTGIMTHNEAYRLGLLYPIWDQVDDLLTQVIDLTLSYNDDQDKFNVQIFTSRSFDDEFQAAIVKDIPLMPMAFTVMTIFTCFVFAKWDRIQSQTLLGWGAVWGVLFSILTGYGLMFVCGIPLTSATQIVVFVMFGIGLDDAFIIRGSYTRTDPNKDPVERIADTIDDIGLSIAITTLTSALAFATGCISSINAVYWLCLYAFPTIVIDFVYMITFFVALIVLDERRMQRRKMDCLVCVTVQRGGRRGGGGGEDDNDDDEKDHDLDKSNEEEEEDTKGTETTSNEDQTKCQTMSRSTRFMNAYANILLQPRVKALVLVAFTALLGACIWGTTQLRQEMDFADLVPKDSHVKGFFEADYDHFEESMESALYFRFVDQSDPDIRQQMQDYVDDLVAENVITQQPAYFWVRDFDTFIAANGTTTEGTTFGEQMGAFLANPLYHSLYNINIIRDPITGDVVNSRVWIQQGLDLSNSKEIINQLALLRDIAGSQPVNEGVSPGDFRFFCHDEQMNMWEFYTVVPEELVFTTVAGVVTVSIIGVAFIPHWTAIFFVLPSILTVYIDLLGFLYFVGVKINPVSYITLVMSIGLLVDFIMHILLRYYECHTGSREDRVRETLGTMGCSILVGGVSTFLGVMLLAFSTSTIFSTIFRAFIGLVLLGCSYGLILLPVVLSLVGPQDGYEAPTQAIAEKGSDPAAAKHGNNSRQMLDDTSNETHNVDNEYPPLAENLTINEIEV